MKQKLEELTQVLDLINQHFLPQELTLLTTQKGIQRKDQADSYFKEPTSLFQHIEIFMKRCPNYSYPFHFYSKFSEILYLEITTDNEGNYTYEIETNIKKEKLKKLKKYQEYRNALQEFYNELKNIYKNRKKD